MDTKKELTTESLIVLFVMVLCVSGFTAFIDRFFSISQNSFQAIASIGLVSAILMIVVIKFYGFENFEILENLRRLEITPAKKCDLGPYTWGPANSPTRQYCTDVSNQQAISEVMCDKPGFMGRPVHYFYTPESGKNWENPRDCNTLDSDRDPMVL